MDSEWELAVMHATEWMKMISLEYKYVHIEHGLYKCIWGILSHGLKTTVLFCLFGIYTEKGRWKLPATNKWHKISMGVFHLLF